MSLLQAIFNAVSPHIREPARKIRPLALAMLAGIFGAAATLAADNGWISKHFRDNPAVGMVLTGDGTRILSLDALKQRAAAARYVLLGEIHPNPDHHRLQAAIVAHMIDQGRRPAIVIEMVTAAQQPVLDHAARTGPEALAELPGRLEWARRGWPDFTMYRPVFELALRHRLPLEAGNLSRSTVRRLGGRVGARLTDEERAALGLDTPLSPTAASRLNRQIAEAHCNVLPQTVLPLMVDIQRARDIFMARALQRADTGDGAVLIAGSGHTRRETGVGALVKRLDPTAHVLSVAFAEATKDETDPAAYASDHDLVMITPRSELTDHCAELRKQLGLQ